MTLPFYNQLQYIIMAAMFLMLAAAIFEPRYGILGYLIVMIFRPGSLYPFLGAIRFELLVGIFLAVLVIIKERTQLASHGYHNINKAIYLFFCVVYLSVLQAFDFSHSLDYAYRLSFLIFAFYIMFVCFLEKIEDIKLFIFVYILIVVWMAYMPIYNYIMGIGKLRIGADIIHSKGIVGMASGHVGLANSMTQSIPFAYFMFLGEKNKIKKLMLLGALVVFVVATISSGSRGGFLGLVICAGLIWYKANKKVIASVVMGAVIIAALGLNPNYLNWVSTILDFGGSDVSAHSRIVGLQHGIEMAAKRPILGVGIGCYALARSAWFHWGIWAHNHYGELIGELGILGVLSWGLLIYLCFKEIRRIRDYINKNPHVEPFYGYLIDACWSVLILRLIIGMTTHSLMAFVWYMIAGILVVTSKSLEKTYPDFVLEKEKTKLSS